MIKSLMTAACSAVMILGACSPTVKVKHEVAPIFITVDVNIKVQKELEDFFNFEEEVKPENKQ
ncbi:MAG: hypothetical protein ACREOO_10720 [bacterium]